MLDPTNVPSVLPEESVARYVLFSNHIRNSDMTVKPDAFIPHPNPELSVTRHIEATEEELWRAGAQVAGQRQRTLHGRADVIVAVCLAEGLSVVAVPLEENPNHADISGWPKDKAEQKMKALEIARQAKFQPTPST